jgi:hypothetical protein
MGIEPITAAWKAAAIPFCNARRLSGRPDLNRRPLRPKRSALPSAPRPAESEVSIPLLTALVKATAPRTAAETSSLADWGLAPGSWPDSGHWAPSSRWPRIRLCLTRRRYASRLETTQEGHPMRGHP